MMSLTKDIPSVWAFLFSAAQALRIYFLPSTHSHATLALALLMIIRLLSKSNLLFSKLPEPLAVNLHPTWSRAGRGTLPEDVAHVVQEPGGGEQQAG